MCTAQLGVDVVFLSLPHNGRAIVTFLSNLLPLSGRGHWGFSHYFVAVRVSRTGCGAMLPIESLIMQTHYDPRSHHR